MLDIDWSEVPEGYDWAAQDEDGRIYAFDHVPSRLEGDYGVWDGFNQCVFFLRRDKPNKNWKKSLRKRPKK